MLKRVIPVLLLKDGLLVRSQRFRRFQAIGDPIPTIKRFSDWNVDELVLINIGGTGISDSRRDDKWHNLGSSNFFGIVEAASMYCNCPLTVGGGINSIHDLEQLFQRGADKCIVNSACITNKDLVKHAVDMYGSQAVVGAIDVSVNKDGLTSTFIANGSHDTRLSLGEHAKYLVEELGVGEVFLSSIDRDGSKLGYEPAFRELLNSKPRVPIVVNSGAYSSEHFKEMLEEEHVSGCAASNVFYFTELAYPTLKKKIRQISSAAIREPDIDDAFNQREPSYSWEKKTALIEKLSAGNYVDPARYMTGRQVQVKYCTRCLYPSLSATPMEFDSDGVCMGCRVSDAKLAQDAEYYQHVGQSLRKLINEQTRRSNYDCIVSVSGGKDSYYQVHYVTKILGLKALLVTYNGNNYTPVGWKNLWRMGKVFDCDHIVVSPAVSTLKKLNRLAFAAMGDMNWHAHVGIFTTAPKIAIEKGISLIFWGEHGYADLCGQFSVSDFPEMNYRERTEHAARGFDWPFFVGLEGLTEADMDPWKYPSDKEILSNGLRQIYLGHYIPWESNSHLQLVVNEYGFEISDEPFERTYRTGSNLDDMHENGIHDYLKYIKFGYGRCTDHASKDIRAGILTREEGIRRVNRMDPIKPKDLHRWLEYVDMSEIDFDRIADHFRDPRVWSLVDKQWKRDILEY